VKVACPVWRGEQRKRTWITKQRALLLPDNRRRDRVKILYWGQSGFCIWYQQLEKGTYQIPDATSLEEQDTLEVTRSQLSLILDGIDLSSVRQRPRFQLVRESARTD
jgi:hypothetical protein